jgi:hypothetical protein
MVGRIWADTKEKKAYLEGLQATYQVLMGGDDMKGKLNVPQRNWLREVYKEFKAKFDQEIGSLASKDGPEKSGMKVCRAFFEGFKK